MKLNRLLLIAISGLVPAVAFGVGPKAAPQAPVSGPAEVNFLEPEKFTDIRGTAQDQSDRNGYLVQLRDHIMRLASEYLPEGHRLQMTFTDVDLAGDFPPVRSAAVDHVRAMKDIYPPRMEFSYRVMDASGNVVKEGKENLTDPNYMTTGALTERQDPLRYDKMLLSDWFRKNFRK